MKAVVFDFDGVLADTYDYSRGILEQIDIHVSEEIFRAHHDGNVYASPKIPFTEESEKVFCKKYIKDIKKVKPFFTRGELKQLNRYDLFIISSNAEEGINLFLTHYHLDMFQEVLGCGFDHSKRRKLSHIIKEYRFLPDECVFVTDTIGDIKEAREAGIQSIAVDFGYHNRERLKQSHPVRIVSSFSELKSTIASFHNKRDSAI